MQTRTRSLILTVLSFTGLYIVNEAKSHEPGTHWISLHITPKKRKNVYFNSYGRKPTLKEIENFLGHKYVYNKKTVQHMLSTSYGQWSIFHMETQWELETPWNHKSLQHEEATSQWLCSKLLDRTKVQNRSRSSGQKVLDWSNLQTDETSTDGSHITQETWGENLAEMRKQTNSWCRQRK